MKSTWSKVVKSRSLFLTSNFGSSQVRCRSVRYKNGSPFRRAIIFLSNDSSCMIMSHENQMECSKQVFTVLKGMESPFSG